MTYKIQQVNAYKISGYPESELYLTYEEAAEVALWIKLRALYSTVYAGTDLDTDNHARRAVLEFITNNPQAVLDILCDYVDKKL